MTTDLLTRPGTRLWTPQDLEILDAATRREFLAGLAAAGLLAACGDDDRGGGDAGGDAGTQTFTDDVGREVEIPRQPQRIVSLDAGTLGFLVALGRAPLGSCSQLGGSFPERIAGELVGVDSLGDCEEGFPFERIAALDPDLILGWTIFGDESEGDLARLSQIAPTVAIPFDQQNRIAPLRVVGRILGDERAATARLAQFDDRIAAARARVAGRAGGLAVVTAREPGIVTLFGDEFFFCTLVGRLGLSFSPDVTAIENYDRDGGRVDVSIERLDVLAGTDVIVALDPSGVKTEFAVGFDAVLANPLWERLPAVQAGRVVRLGGWLDAFGNSGPIGYEVLIDQLAQAIERFP